MSLPVEVSNALIDMQADTMAVAAAFVILAVTVAGFMWIRKPAESLACATCGAEITPEQNHGGSESPICSSCVGDLYGEMTCEQCGNSYTFDDSPSEELCGDCVDFGGSYYS